MKYFTCLIAVLFAVACGKQKDPHEGHDHGSHDEHKAKHGGDLIEIGSHEGHVEVKLDHDKGTLVMWIYNSEMEDWKADAAPVVNFTLDGKPHSLTGEGEGAEWLFSDPVLKGEPGNIRFRVKAGGATYQAKWDHAHADHDHAHGDHDEGHDHDSHDEHKEGSGHDHDEGHEKGHDDHDHGDG